MCIYIKNGLLLKPRHDMSRNGAEALFVEVRVGRNCYLLGSIYRPPRADDSFWIGLNDIMEQSADSTEDSCKPSLLLGYFNVNVCQPSHHRTRLDAMCADYNLRLLSTGPTHYAPTGISTTIDLVFASESLVIETCDVLVECLSDHLPILATLQIPTSKCKIKLD